jgi:flagellar protein FlaG
MVSRQRENALFLCFFLQGGKIMSLEITGIANNGMAGIPKAPAFRRTHQQGTSPPEGEEHTEKPDQNRIVQIVQEIEKYSNLFNRRLKYSINRELDQVVVKVIDAETDKVIKVLPPEEMQRLHLRIREAVGLLFDETI